MEINKSTRNIGLDILKAIGLISVMIYHWYEFKGTYIGVLFFFVVSGYLITLTLVEVEESYYSFLKRRILRIYPTLLLVLVAVLLAFYHFNGFLTPRIIGSSISSIFGVSNIYQIIKGMSYFERSGDIFPLLHTWTLSIELQFYLVFPFIIYLFKKKQYSNKKSAIILFVFSLLSLGIMIYKVYNDYDISNIYYGTGSRIFSVLMGGVFYFYFKDRECDRKNLNILATISLLITVASLFLVDYTMQINYYGLLYLLSFLIGVVVLAVIKINFLNYDNFILKSFSQLGKKSYAYYLWQYPLMIFSLEYFKWMDIDYNLTVFIQVIILIILSEFSYNYMEKKKDMAKKLGFLFLMVYILLLNILPFSRETTAETIEKRIEQIDKESVNNEIEEKISKINEELKNNEEDLMLKRIIEESDKNIEIKDKPTPFVNKHLKTDEKEDVILDNSSNTESKMEKPKEEKVEKSVSEDKKVENNSIKEDEKIDTQNKVEQKEISTPVPQSAKYTFIGDSVMKMGEPYIKRKLKGAIVDAKVSRQFTQLPQILGDLKAKNMLKDIIIIHLGTNGLISKDAFDKTMKELQGKKVYFMNCVVPKPWEQTINSNLENWIKDYPNAHIINWYKYAKGKKELFYKDATHPTPEGADIYANFIIENIK